MFAILTVFGFATLCCLMQTGDAAVPKFGTNGCQNANAETDKNLQIANSLMISQNFDTVDIDDFQLALPLTIFGWRLPWNVSLSASSGLLRFGNMSRAGDAMDCSTESASILYSVISYDRAKFRYLDTSVTFWKWEADGQLSNEFRPSVNVTLAEDSALGCRVASSPMRSVEDLDYEFQPKSWKGWFLGKLLRHTLWSADTPMKNYFQQASHSLIGTFFTDQWCTSH